MSAPAATTQAGLTARSLFRNSVSQIVGRLALSAGRLVVAALIVRLAGAERFGEYTLVLSFLLMFEWLVDFGQTDIAVRDIAREPGDEAAILRALAWLKGVQGVVFALLLPATLWLLAYPRPLVGAAAIGAVGVLAYAVLQVFRTLFKIRMRMDRDIGAELVGAAVLLPLTWLASHRGAGVEVLIGCYAASRVVFFLVSLVLARAELKGVDWRGPLPRGAPLILVRQALPLGLSGLAVLVYDGLAPVLLSKIADMELVAHYSAPARYIFAVLTVVQALNTAFFPLLSRHWNRSVDEFAALQQTALELSVLIGVGFVCCAAASAAFLMGLIGPEVADAAPVLRLMCCIVLVRTVSTAMSPLIVIGGRQQASMWLTLTAIVLQVVFLALFVPRWGAIGAVLGYLLVEVCCVVPVVLIGQRAGGVRLDWGRPALLAACGGAALLAVRLTPMWNGWLAGLACPVLFLALALATGAVSVRKLQKLWAALVDRGLASG